jgi:molecular chaperone GrpE
MPEEISKEEEYLNGWKRAKADLINYQKDEAKRFEEVVKFANAAIIKDLIVVLDSFNIALEVLEKQEKSEKGIYMIKAQLEDILKKNGLETMASSVGSKFDPNFHEAVAEVESEKPAGTIIEEIEKGYLLNGRVIRPTKVKLSKAHE